MTSKNIPTMSIVTAVFNGAGTLEKCIDSVATQSYAHHEHIFIDAGSTDGTVDILRTNADKIGFWVSEPDKGIYDAWNKALLHVNGDWILFLGADDYLISPEVLSKYAALIEQHPDCEFVSSKLTISGRIVGKPWKWSKVKSRMTIAHPGALHHRSMFEKLGKFNDSYKIAGDYEFLLRAGPMLKAEFLDEVSVFMGDAGSSNTSSRVFDETLRAKVESAGRSRFSATVEKNWAMLKWRVKRGLTR